MSRIYRTDCTNTDCWAHNSNDECRVLCRTEWNGKPCPFFKTRQQILEDDARSEKRIKELYGVDLRTYMISRLRNDSKEAQITENMSC